MDGINLTLLLLLLAFVFSLGFGLSMAYQERRTFHRVGHATPGPGDEEMLIFDRVTLGLSQLPPIEEPKALDAAQTDVMRHVGDQYGLSATEVERIYRRVWHWKHGAAA